MYTRTYNDGAGDIIIPEKYGGTSLGQKSLNDIIDPPDRSDKTVKNPWENEEDVHTSDAENDEKSVETSATEKTPLFSSVFSKIFKSDTFGLQKIGTEELLIIATAAFLLFSKEGDKECAIMLILLLFLK